MGFLDRYAGSLSSPFSMSTSTVGSFREPPLKISGDAHAKMGRAYPVTSKES